LIGTIRNYLKYVKAALQFFSRNAGQVPVLAAILKDKRVLQCDAALYSLYHSRGKLFRGISTLVQNLGRYVRLMGYLSQKGENDEQVIRESFCCGRR
jgi:hypothetical protein